MGDPGWVERLFWEHEAIRIREQLREQLEIVREGVLEGQRHEAGKRRVVNAVHWKEQASVIAKELPRDPDLLEELLLQDRSLSMEQRGKILEVIILRGADNKFAYHALDQLQHLEGIGGHGGEAAAERMRYQSLALKAVLDVPSGGQLFSQVSRSIDQLPSNASGRYPATEWMNTMLRDGGLLGTDEQRQRFETWLTSLPPFERGQAMYHLHDAAETKEIGGGARVTGFEISAGPAGFGVQWEAKDAHWQVVVNDVTAPVKDSLIGDKSGGPRSGEQKARDVEEFNKGFGTAARTLPGVDK